MFQLSFVSAATCVYVKIFWWVAQSNANCAPPKVTSPTCRNWIKSLQIVPSGQRIVIQAQIWEIFVA